MGKNIEKILRGILIFGCCYFLFEAVLYLSNIRLTDVGNNWPSSAKVYAKLINQVLGSFELLVSLVCFELQKDLKKYSRLIKVSGFWALIHAAVLISLAASNNFTNIFTGMPSLYVWADFYNQYVFLEAGLLIFYSLTVFLWSRKNG